MKLLLFIFAYLLLDVVNTQNTLNIEIKGGPGVAIEGFTISGKVTNDTTNSVQAIPPEDPSPAPVAIDSHGHHHAEEEEEDEDSDDDTDEERK